ncbi:MAG: protein kinase [Candidatus Nitrosopelagicus sp.]|nr:protein kinase [Candidatus Nitrosopelagicus sp.]
MTANSIMKGKFDTYKIIKTLPAAAGGMASVSFATNSRGQEVVIKSPKITGDGNDDMRIDKLRVEAEILRDISTSASHNCIVKYLDESAQSNDFFLVIEKINGKTIKELVTSQPLTEQAVLGYFENIIKALNFIHKKNIIHRDIKPNNIIIDPIRGPVLIDFGAAKQGWTQMQQGQGNETIIGTPGWSCPHQFTGGLSTSCDIYSAGAVLFYMLVGKEPKFYMNSTHTLTQEPNQVRSGISREISTIVKNSIDPDHRLVSSADDLLMHSKKSVSPSITQPYILLEGIKYQLKNETDIGRAHQTCDRSCHSAGYQIKPTIPLIEKGRNYLSKHHIRIWKDGGGYFWIQDLRSRNGSAIFSNGSYRRLTPGKKELLNPKSVVALCYNASKGAYITFTFHER